MILLMAEGKTLYLGLCQRVPELFESYGFRCPERKAVADFLQDASSFAYFFLCKIGREIGV